MCCNECLNPQLKAAPLLHTGYEQGLRIHTMKYKEVPLKVLTSFGTSFLSALAVVLGLMLVVSLFDSHALKPLAAVSIATSLGLANAIRTWKDVSPNAFALLVAALAGGGAIVGSWLSNG